MHGYIVDPGETSRRAFYIFLEVLSRHYFGLLFCEEALVASIRTKMMAIAAISSAMQRTIGTV